MKISDLIESSRTEHKGYYDDNGGYHASKEEYDKATSDRYEKQIKDKANEDGEQDDD